MANCSPLGEALAALIKDLKLKSTQARGVNFANFNNNDYLPSEIGNRNREDPELDELNDAIEQVR